MLERTVFEDIARRRRATRQFLPAALAPAQIEAVLRDAQHAPSNCNTQPWHVHIVSGPMREKLSAALLLADAQGRLSPDFSFDMGAYSGVYAERQKASGKAHYEALGIARGDDEARQAAVRRNLEFFGAPHVALLFMPAFGDCVRTAGDLGMYGQTFLLSLAARGFAGIPQTCLGMYAQTVRDVLGIGNDRKMLFGISFGYSDAQASVNNLTVGRAELSESVVFHE